MRVLLTGAALCIHRLTLPHLDVHATELRGKINANLQWTPTDRQPELRPIELPMALHSLEASRDNKMIVACQSVLQVRRSACCAC